MIKKTILLSLVSTVLLVASGCGNTVSTTDTGSTSTTATTATTQVESVMPNTEDSTIDAAVDNNQLDPADLESILTQYYTVKATNDANDIDEDNLDAEYRTGKIDKAAFSTKKNEYQTLEADLDRQEDQLEADLRQLGWDDEAAPSDLDTSADLNDLKNKMDELSIKEQQFELDSDILEREYSTGTIKRDEFIQKKIELERKSDELDKELDIIEQNLEAMGWDD